MVTGLENSTYIEIKSGLSLGDTVYYTKKKSNFRGSMSSNRGNRGEMGSGMGTPMPMGGSGGSGFGGTGNRPNFGNRS